MYSTLSSLQRKRYLFVCINRRAEENPKGCCAAKDSEEVVTVADVPEIVDGLVKGQPVKRLVITADQHNGAGWDQRHRR